MRRFTPSTWKKFLTARTRTEQNRRRPKPSGTLPDLKTAVFVEYGFVWTYTINKGRRTFALAVNCRPPAAVTSPTAEVGSRAAARRRPTCNYAGYHGAPRHRGFIFQQKTEEKKQTDVDFSGAAAAPENFVICSAVFIYCFGETCDTIKEWNFF